MQLHRLEPGVPEAHEGWTDEDYAGRIMVALGRAGNRFLELNGDGAQDDTALQSDLAEALVAAMEWAHRRGWPLAQDFGLRLDWQNHSFLYLILRAGEGISTAHWGALHNNPARAMEQLNFAIGYLVDYCRWRGWPVEAAAARIITEHTN